MKKKRHVGLNGFQENNTSQPHLYHRRHVDDRAQAGYRGTSVLYHFGISLFIVQNSDLYMP